MSTPNMTTVDQITNWLSAAGAGLRIDHNPGGAMNQAVVYASNDVGYYLSMRYGDLDVLAANPWVQMVATTRAVMYLCLWRLNAVPPGLLAVWQDYEDKLVDVQQGKGNIPGLPAGTSRDRTPQLVGVTNTLMGPIPLRKTYSGSSDKAGTVPRGWSWGNAG